MELSPSSKADIIEIVEEFSVFMESKVLLPSSEGCAMVPILR
jgi:hypothetical protein